MSDVLVLCYHAVNPSWPAPMSIAPDAFERQLRFLDNLEAVAGLLALAVAQLEDLVPVIDLGQF